MSEITINRTHHLTQHEIEDRVTILLTKLEDRFAIKSEWESKASLIFRGKGVKGTLCFDENSVQIVIHLGLMYRALKSSITTELNARLDRYLA